MLHCRSLFKSLLVVVIAGLWASRSWAQQVHRNGFETLQPAWIKTGGDAQFDELTHEVSNQTVHNGQRSEHLKINAGQGTNIYYRYPVGKGLITDELVAGVWLKGNRPGIQLMARVVLPGERDPNNLDAYLTTFIRGDQYRTVGRWQRVEIGRPVQLATQQQQLMQAQLGRPLNFKDAFIDALFLNLYAGPGATEVWIDDLEVGPVQAADVFQPEKSPAAPGGSPETKGPVTGEPVKLTRPSSARQSTNPQDTTVEFNGAQLLVGGQPFFFRGIRFTDTSLRSLRDAGFNTIWFNYTTDPKLLKEAVDFGFWLVPSMDVMGQESRLSSADDIRREMARFSESNSVLFWHLGGTLAQEQVASVARVSQFMHAIDPLRPLAADVWDGLAPYSRHLQLVCVHRWPFGTTLELPRYHDWLSQRSQLANPGTFLWTWIQTHTPDWYTYLLYNQSGSAAFKEPVGPQPEQIRLLTYTALGAGCSGLGFWSDRFLADSHFGRDRLLAIALLNQELEMLEPLLSTKLPDHTQWIDTSSNDVKAAVIRTARGVLVIPVWQGSGAQLVPGQAAAKKLTITVPQVPPSQRAWEITPADVRGLRSERVVGGTKVTLPEFGLTALIVFTSDFAAERSLIGRLQMQTRSRRQIAAQWSYDMAVYELDKVLKVERELEQQGHILPDGKQLLDDAQARLKNARQYWENRLFVDAYNESQRALRPIRIMMRAQWDKAVKELTSPAASPFAVSFFTLARHWHFMEEVRKAVPSGNILPGGDFKVIADQIQEPWRVEESTLDDVELQAKRVSNISIPGTKLPKTEAVAATGQVPAEPAPASIGKQCLMMQIKPKIKVPVQANQPPPEPPLALERTLLALTSPDVHLQPGTLVQVTGWIHIPKKITASPDGALLYDSAGGEPLAVRLTGPMPWKKFVLYRRVPDSGTMHVTVALTGLGTAYFDDIRIEPLVNEADLKAGHP